MNSRIKKATCGTIAALGLFAGSAAISAAATSSESDPAPVVTPSEDTEDTGINCENGIDTATNNECDGGPTAAAADEANEAPDNEADEAEANEAESDEADDGIDHQNEGEEVGENGDGIPDADDVNEAD